MKSAELPAILGGTPVFDNPIPLTRPSLNPDQEMWRQLADSLNSGMITDSHQTRALEHTAAEFLGVEHVIATTNCTTGLMLVLRCLDLTGTAIVPSFTFMATGHAAVWSGLDVVFADCDDRTYTVGPQDVENARVDGASVVIATHLFGAPCAATELEVVAAKHGLPLVFDAAHAFGATYPDGSLVGGRGTAEVFSLSPTKVFTAAEGGLITTRDGALADELRHARNYGNPGDYDSRFVGMNGRMSELHAVLARANLLRLPADLRHREHLVARYRSRLGELAGITFQQEVQGANSVVKDFTVRIDTERFGMSRDVLATALLREGIPSRKYFDPPLHRQQAYRQFEPRSDLPVTERLAAELLTLPLHSTMQLDYVDRISTAVRRLHHCAARVAQLATNHTTA